MTLIYYIIGLLGEVLLTAVYFIFRFLTILRNLFLKAPIGLTRVRNESGKGPILLIHGLNMDEVIMYWLRWRLLKDNWGPIYILNMGPLGWTVERQGELLREVMASLYEKHGRINIIAHSMGGLVARHFIQNLGGASQVYSLISLATPHIGTPLGYLSHSRPGRQLVPHGDLYRVLDPQSGLPATIRYRFFYSNLDLLVPTSWGAAKNQKNFAEYMEYIPFLGHATITASKRVYQRMLPYLVEAKDQHSLTAHQKTG